MEKAPTMQTIADRAGVSLMTVSMALKNHPRISQATRQRIRLIAQELNYRPNPMVSALMAQIRSSHPKRTPPTLAYIHYDHTPDMAHAEWSSDPARVRLFNGAKTRCEELGFRLEAHVVHPERMPAHRLSRILINRGIQGLLIPASPAFPSMPLEMDWDWFCAVAVGTPLSDPPMHRAHNNFDRTMKMVIEKLTSLGYRRIGFYMLEAGNERNEERWLAGFALYRLHQLARRDKSLAAPLLLAPKPEPEPFKRWVARTRPDAIVTLHGEILHWIGDMGLCVPGDIGLAHLDLDATKANISGVDQQRELMAMQCVDLVFDQLINNRTGIPENPKTLVLESKWVDGETVCGQASPKASRPAKRRRS